MPHCVDKGTIKEIIIKKFNGQNWEKSMEEFPKIKEYSQVSL